MIITRYLFRELLQTLLALTALLLLIYISHRFMVYLVQASAGELPTAVIFKLLALKLLSDLTLILPLGFFLALLLSLGRLYKDNEIAAMAACGIPVPVVSIIGFGVIFAIFIGLLSLLVAPWAEKKMTILQDQLKSAAEVGGIAAGRFKEFNHGKGIFYIENVDAEQNKMHHLFAQATLTNKQLLMVAKQGYQIAEGGELFMVFLDGHRYERKKNSLEYNITNFAEHRIKIPKRLDTSHKSQVEAMSTSDLLFKPDAALQAELQWRLSMPLTVILLAALAIPLSYSTPRQGQYGKLVIGILIYLMHGNLLNVAKKWVEHGDVSPWIGVWWTHVILLMIVLILFNIKFLKNEMHRLSNLFLSFFQSSRTSNLPKA